MKSRRGSDRAVAFLQHAGGMPTDTQTGDLTKLYELVEDLEIAMMTTRRRDGHLRSRAMATQRRAAGADLWFVTLADTEKLDDLAHDQHVNLAYYRDSNREWVSVSGLAKIFDGSREDCRVVRTGLEDVVSRQWRPALGIGR